MSAPAAWLLARLAVWQRALIAVAVFAAIAAPATASAVTPKPHWSVVSVAAPTYFKAGDEGDYYEVIAMNDGGAPTDGSTITVSDSPPAGVTPTSIVGDTATGLHGLSGTAMTCPTNVSCESTAVVPVGELVIVKIHVNVGSELSGDVTNTVTIVGGGAQAATASDVAKVTPEPVPFGASISSGIVAADGGVDSQAGSHPMGFTTIASLNVASVNTAVECALIIDSSPGCPRLNADVKDLEVPLPAGLVGNPQVVPHCSQAVFQTFGNNSCPADTQVGVMHLFFYGSGTAIQYAPIYNVEPPPGQPAELGFTVAGSFHIPMFFHVRSDGDYGLTARLQGISEADPVRLAAITIWGVPASSSHNVQREGPEGSGCSFGCASGVEERPFLRLPTSCPASTSEVPLLGDSWQRPEAPGGLMRLASTSLSPTVSCEALSFTPSLSLEPDTLQAGAPAAYDVLLDVPQNEDPEGLGSPDVRDVEVTLPPGVVLSPSAANGLAACAARQFGLHSGLAGECPAEAKIGQLMIATPLLAQPLRGNLYVGSPECSPCTVADAESGKMVPLLLEAEGSGVLVKASGKTIIDQQTGQLTTTFTDAPQLPFGELEVALKGGQDAPLVNPHNCGPVPAVGHITPWSATTPTETLTLPIPISGCATPVFTPSFRAGTTATAQAGAFSPFSVTLSRPDGQQDLGSLTMSMPPGLLGMLSNVSLCGETDANAGTCPASSQIGSASTTLGPGSLPLTVGGGKVYLTGPYKGRPFGLSIVVPAEAGPFKLAGNTGDGTEVVRASIAVNPYTSALTITSDALPQQLNGIPLDIRAIDVDVDRPGFILNPTDCDAMSIGGTVTSATGTVVSVSFPFQVVNCATLPFHPSFTALTQAKTSKANGASLHVRVTSTPGQANIAKVRTSLPKQLPSRLTTLQKACLAAVFEANPSSCPAASNVGTATAVTPILKAPLTGPAYLVSHGGAAFPDLEIVLQGEGITLILDGNTNIKNGITTTTFNALPDAPVSSFDLVLPTGPHSALGAALPRASRNSLCGQRLTMPTTLTGQNGAVLTEATKIGVSGCPKHHQAKARKRHRHRRPTRRK